MDSKEISTSDSFPRPGEDWNDFMTLGRNCGLLYIDAKDKEVAHLVSEFFDDELFVAINDPDIRAMRQILKYMAMFNSIEMYIHYFLNEFEVANNRVGVQKFYAALETTKKRLAISGLNLETMLRLVGFHFYMQDVPRAPHNPYPDPTEPFAERARQAMASRVPITEARFGVEVYIQELLEAMGCSNQLKF